ncbi:hypothetical protein GCM10027280_02570 [Micromonospora polyrhachis]
MPIDQLASGEQKADGVPVAHGEQVENDDRTATEKQIPRRVLMPWAEPYDPANSPGPIPSVVERFRWRPDRPAAPSEAEREAARYTVVLVSPDAAESMGRPRYDVGLRVYQDDDLAHDALDLDEAVDMIEKACGEPITLVEHRADLTYWTVRVRPSS